MAQTAEDVLCKAAQLLKSKMDGHLDLITTTEPWRECCECCLLGYCAGNLGLLLHLSKNRGQHILKTKSQPLAYYSVVAKFAFVSNVKKSEGNTWWT